jgi:hypothetical protein
VPHHVPVERQPGILHRDGAAQHAGQQRDGLRRAGGDDDLPRVGGDPAGTPEVVGERRAQFGSPAGVAVVERRGRRGVQRAPGGAQPRGGRERGDVRAAGPQVVPRRGGVRRCRRRTGTRSRQRGDLGAGAGARAEEALGDELVVRGADRVAGQVQLGGERPGGGQAGTGSQPPGPHRLT